MTNGMASIPKPIALSNQLERGFEKPDLTVLVGTHVRSFFKKQSMTARAETKSILPYIKPTATAKAGHFFSMSLPKKYAIVGKYIKKMTRLPPKTVNIGEKSYRGISKGKRKYVTNR